MKNHLIAKIGQYALITNNDDNLLVLERARSKTWCLPGGRLDEDEDWAKSFIREIKEELNLECKNPIPFTINVLEDPYQVKYCVYFELACDNLSELKISDEHSSYKWVNLDESMQTNFEDEKVKQVVIQYLKRN